MSRGLNGLRIASAVAFTALAVAALVSFAGRNSSGTMTSANGPYISGTTILTSDINARFSDIETEITDSLSRTGKGPMLMPLRLPDGSGAIPSLAFTGEQASGLYRFGANDVRMGIGGSLRQQWTGTGSAFTGTLSATGDVTASTKVGIGGAPTNTLDATVPGSATTIFGNWLVPALADGNNVVLNVGKTLGTGGVGILTYTKNVTAANSTLCFGVFGGTAGTFCVDGNAKAIIGAGGTGISQSNRGTVSWTPPALPTTGSCASNAVTVTGAVPGAECLIGAPAVPFTVAASCAITAANTCTINLCNTSTVSSTPPSGTYACRAFNP